MGGGTRRRQRGRAAAGLAEAVARMNDACTLLVRGDAAGIAQAGERMRTAADIVGGERHSLSPRDVLCLVEFQRSLKQAGRLVDAAGAWCRHLEMLLSPDDATAPGYGADGRSVPARSAGSMTLHG